MTCAHCSGTGREIYRGHKIACLSCYGSGEIVTHAWIGKRDACGCVTAMCIEIPGETKELNTFVHEMIQSDRTPMRVTLEESRKIDYRRCECPRL